MINHGLSTGGLFLDRRAHLRAAGTPRPSPSSAGWPSVMPVYATLTLIIFLASMGLPLLNGFIGELMILQGAFSANRVWAYWAVLGHRAGSGLPALALSARLLGQGHERGEPAPRRPEPPRAGDARPADRACASGSASIPSRSWRSCTAPWRAWPRSSSPGASRPEWPWPRRRRTTRLPRTPPSWRHRPRC